MRIQKLHNLKKIKDVYNFDFTLSDKLVREDSYDKGRKVLSEWKDQSESLCVSVNYEDILDENSNLIGTLKKILWYNENNEAVLFKVMRKKFFATIAGTELHNRRKRAIDYLKHRGVELNIKDKVDTLFLYYKDSLYDYIENNTTSFDSAIRNESDPEIIKILDYKPDISNGVDLELNPTIREHILSQLN